MTQCEIDDEGESEEEFDEDSIETNDFGSGLSSSEEDTNAVDTYSANINRIKEKDACGRGSPCIEMKFASFPR